MYAWLIDALFVVDLEDTFVDLGFVAFVLEKEHRKENFQEL
jgi:hypothetical protein